MENATKALVMAGAILIAIMLISIGLLIFNSTKGIVDQGNKAAKIMEIEAYNSNFNKYCGDNVSGTNVKSLQNVVSLYNSANGTSVVVNLSGITTIYPNKYYKVYVPETGYTDGYITSITVEAIN